MSNINVYNHLTKQTENILILSNTEYTVFTCIIRYLNVTEIQIIAVKVVIIYRSQKSKCEFHLPMARLTSGKLIHIVCKNMHSTFSNLKFD